MNVEQSNGLKRKILDHLVYLIVIISVIILFFFIQKLSEDSEVNSTILMESNREP